MTIDSKDVVERLSTLGYNLNDGDIVTLQLAINGVEQYIKNFCNITEIPAELYYVAVDMAAGTLLKTKQSIGVNVCESIDYSTAGISSIKEGDLTINFSTSDSNSTANMFSALLKKLCNRDAELAAFRKLRW
ncbi:MAG: hypothetical protein Q4D26_09215 [Clostridia bacterium]|nr:hypothetical protein [Clostridia bacterium]